MRVERHVFDSWRANRVTVPEHIEERLVSEFTELANYRTDIPDVVNDSEEQGQYVKMEPGMVSEMITMQRDMIKMLREEIARKTVEAERLRGEVKALREMRGKG